MESTQENTHTHRPVLISCLLPYTSNSTHTRLLLYSLGLVLILMDSVTLMQPCLLLLGNDVSLSLSLFFFYPLKLNTRHSWESSKYLNVLTSTTYIVIKHGSAHTLKWFDLIFLSFCVLSLCDSEDKEQEKTRTKRHREETTSCGDGG